MTSQVNGNGRYLRNETWCW